MKDALRICLVGENSINDAKDAFLANICFAPEKVADIAATTQIMASGFLAAELALGRGEDAGSQTFKEHRKKADAFFKEPKRENVFGFLNQEKSTFVIVYAPPKKTNLHCEILTEYTPYLLGLIDAVAEQGTQTEKRFARRSYSKIGLHKIGILLSSVQISELNLDLPRKALIGFSEGHASVLIVRNEKG